MAKRTADVRRGVDGAGRLIRPLVIPVLAIMTALLLGGAMMLLSGDNPVVAYRALYVGAFGNLNAISRTIRVTTPFIFTGLSVAFAFKAGLFNIGASGQLLMGAIAAVAVGASFPGLPRAVHLLLALLAGTLAGAVWGAIPGLLKVWRGAHEVITTIMLNYVASLFVGWTVSAGGTAQLRGPLADPQQAARAISESRRVFESARIPPFLPEVLDRVHWGVVLALLLAVLAWWVLSRTTLGFEIRSVGASLTAARYAGIRVRGTAVLAMAVAGALAGLAGTVDALGLHYMYSPGFTGAAGFDGITVALLAKTHPLGVVAAAGLMGALYGGATRMQFAAGVPAELIQVVQALVLIFVAAPEIVRAVYRIRRPVADETLGETLASSTWGGGATPDA